MALTFNATYYYQNRPDVLTAYLASDMSVTAQQFAMNHYDAFGWEEGSNPNEVFNTNEYLAENPDVDAAGVNPFQHYQMFGQAEGRAPNGTFPSLAEFQFQAYLDANPDLGAAGIDTAAEAYDHYITFGYDENRPGAPDSSEFQLANALNTLQASNEGVVDFLEGARSNEYLIEEQDVTETTSVGQVRIDIGEEYTAAAALLETETNLTDFGTRSEALQNQAIADGVATRTTAITELNADIAEIDGLGAAIAAYQAADEADETADEAAAEAELDSVAGLASYNARVAGDFDFLNQAGTPVDLAAGDINDVDRVENAAGVVIIEWDAAEGEFVFESAVVTPTAAQVELLGTLNANVEAQADADAAQLTLDAADATLDGFDTEVAAADFGAINTGVGLAGEVDARAAELADFNEDVARFQNADALADALEALDNAVVAATDAFEDLGYEAPVTVDGAELATAEADLYVAGDVDGTITGFASDDLLFVGGGYTALNLEAGADLDATDVAGSSSALEIFFQQDGANTIVYIENEAFAGNDTTGAFDGQEITLVGVDASSVSLDASGFIRVAEPAIA